MRDFANLQAQDWWTRMVGRAGLAMVFAAVLAFLAPFGTYRFDVMGRVGYWTVQMGAWLILSAAAEWLVARSPRVGSQSAGRRRIVETGIATLPMIVVVGVANNMMNGWLPFPEEVAELFVSIALIGGGFTYVADRLVGGLVGGQGSVGHGSGGEGSVGHGSGGEGNVDHAHHAGAPVECAASDEARVEEDVPSDPTLIDRLPPHVRVDIICLQVEDHYVRVYSRTGNAMVLMRFSDALRGVDHIPGSQVHRSWWVARSAVEGFRRTGRTAQIGLCNGLSVPVSAPYLSQATASWGALETSAA